MRRKASLAKKHRVYDWAWWITFITGAVMMPKLDDYGDMVAGSAAIFLVIALGVLLYLSWRERYNTGATGSSGGGARLQDDHPDAPVEP
ncbi:hypothetical protein GCM10010156_27080 [Planobispora rosea]|uniref:Uncharacterized protein n=1 Tax=Planobispora rosea TaxID=35762 RepID=A0A8J3WD91_PLARO|nr:hypothetical protein [Planobispora rosea]GGS66782.1 hypothetical protein GCM10010156_27080 [Planobispora rosea]GIH85070.1 hypothetical protein Pro02_34780 [Planobispora rosea]